MSKNPSFLSSLKNSIVIEPKVTDVSKQYCMLFLHGLGDTPHGWVDVAAQFSKSMPEYRFILPCAPVQPVTLNYGMEMTSWYDINGLDPKSREDHAGVEKSYSLIQKIINEQVENGISVDRIALCGFSQGGAVSLYAGIKMAVENQVLGCVVALSSYLPCREQLLPHIKSSKEVQTPPILMCHGTDDEIVSMKWAEQSKSVLSDHDWVIKWKTYPRMGHSACPTEIKDFYTFLKTTVTNKPKPKSPSSSTPGKSTTAQKS